MPSDICLLLLNPFKCHNVRFPSKRSYLHMGSGVEVLLQDFRMRTRVLSLPTCPDWRKVRVGNKEVDEVPTEWEMEQMALDKLKLRRQQSLAQRHTELIRLQQQVMAESMDQLNELANVDFMTPIANNHNSSLMFHRTNRSQSLSLQNLVEFGQMETTHIPVPTHALRKTSYLSDEKLAEIQHTKKLDELRKELEEFKALQLQTKSMLEDAEDSGRSALTLDSPQGSHKFRESNLSLVSLDWENGDEVSEITHKIQRMREKELRRMRKQNLILEYRLKQQMSE